MAYKPTKKQNENLRAAVKRFNSTIDRLNKHYGSGGAAPIIPKKRTMKDIKNSVSNYNEFRRELAALNRITKGKAKDIVEFDNVKMLRYSVNELKNDIRQANKQRSAFRDIIGYNQMRTDSENLRNRKMPDLNKLDREQIEKIMKSASQEALTSGQMARLEQLKENYKKGIRENVRKDDAERLENMVDQIDTITFANAYVNDEVENLEFVYGNEKGKASRIGSKLQTLIV